LTYLCRAGAIDASDNVIMFKVSYKSFVCSHFYLMLDVSMMLLFVVDVLPLMLLIGISRRFIRLTNLPKSNFLKYRLH